MKTQRYARKAFFVDAIQVTEENMEEIAAWCQGDVRVVEIATPDAELGEKYVHVRVHRPMSEKQTMAFVGDWVLYAGTGYKVYTPRAFENSFESSSNQLADGSVAMGDEVMTQDQVSKKLSRVGNVRSGAEMKTSKKSDSKKSQKKSASKEEPAEPSEESNAS